MFILRIVLGLLEKGRFEQLGKIYPSSLYMILSVIILEQFFVVLKSIDLRGINYYKDWNFGWSVAFNFLIMVVFPYAKKKNDSLIYR